MLSPEELEGLRAWVSLQTTTILGFVDPNVVNSSLDCIGKSLSRQATTDRLAPYLGSSAPAFVDSLYMRVLQVKSARLSSTSKVTTKRKIEDVLGYVQSSKEEKKIKTESEEDGEERSDSIAASQIEAMLIATKKEIAERKRQTQALLQQTPVASAILPTPTHLMPVPDHQSAVISDAIMKARKAAELQQKIQNQLQGGLLTGLNVKPVIEKMEMPSKPTPLILDAEGRTVDSSGRAVQLSMRQPTLKANIRAQQRNTFKQITTERKPKKAEQQVSTEFFDPRVGAGSMKSKKIFKFNEPGKFIKQGQTLRAKAQLEKLQTEIASSARKTGISSATKLALIAPKGEVREDEIPLVEWWDASILPSRSYTDFDRKVEVQSKYRDISSLVEHPIPVFPPSEPRVQPHVPIMLTKAERKKLRKQRRREAEKERQEKVRFGLMEKPEPKVRISNLMRVLGNEAIQDPTKIEAQVRAQMAERQRKHEEANESRKLTPAQRKAKIINKIKEDVSCGVHVVVFCVRDLSNQSNRFKVDVNAQQFHLTGCILLYRDVNLVIVEGGPKALRKYKRLMLQRIKWRPDTVGDDDNSDDEGTESQRNSCSIVWEGMNQTRCFYDWRVRNCPTENLAREHLKKYGVEHYWDLALSKAIMEQEGEDD